MEKLGYYSGKNAKNNVLSFLERHVEKTPNLIPLRWAKPGAVQKWSFDLKDSIPHDQIGIIEFEERIRRVAKGFLELGLKRGDRAILFLPMSVYMYTAMFALQRIGAIAVFLDSWARRGHLGASAQVVDPKAMISFDQAFELVKDVPELQKIPIKISGGAVPEGRNYTATLESLHTAPPTSPLEPVEQEETALVTFTTGSSGVPKGANRTHRFLAAQHYALDEGLPYFQTDIDLPVFPIFSLNNLAAGVSTVIPAIDVGVPNEKDALILMGQFLSQGVTCATLSPSLLNGLSAYCNKNNIKMSTIRRAVTGGAPISRDNLVDFSKAAPQAETWVLYGSTEVEPMAHIEAKEMIGFKTRASTDVDWVDDGVNVGHLVESLQHKFLKISPDPIFIKAESDWKNVEVAKGEVGELIVAGEHVCRDYYNNTEAFFRAKIKDHKGVVWHRTGDLARVDEHGYLWIVGRVHNAIPRAGTYQFPVRAEIILKKVPQIKYAAYLGLPDAKLGQKTVCVVVPHDKADLESSGAGKIKAEITRLMTKNGMPADEIFVRAEMPMDPRHHSKVEYDVLRNQLLKEGGHQ